MDYQYQVASVQDMGLPLQIIFVHPNFGKQGGAAQQAETERLAAAAKDAGLPGRVAVVWPEGNKDGFKFIAPPTSCLWFDQYTGFSELVALRSNTLTLTSAEAASSVR